MGQHVSSKCSVAGKAIVVRVPVLGISMGVWVPIDVGSFFSSRYVASVIIIVVFRFPQRNGHE